MRGVFCKWIAATAWVLAALLYAAPPAGGQTPAGPAYAPPRTAFGHPDLQGIWQVMNTAAWDIQDHNASLGVPAGKGVVEGNDIPYQPSALEKKRQNYENRAKLDPETRCLLSGVPRITYMPYPFQIVQQADKVNILYEYNHTLRHIYMNGNPHPEGPIEWWMGDSRGRWEGNTLVVETTNFTDKQRLGGASGASIPAGIPFGSFHLTEYFVPVSSNRIEYYATVNDPTTWTNPWTFNLPWERDDDYKLFEYACHEGNYALANSLRGERVLEAEAAKKREAGK